MFSCASFLCSQSYSYGLNYIVQAEMFDSLDKKTEEIEPWKIFVFFFWNASSAVTITSRVAGIGETFFKGCWMVLAFPFTASPLENAKIGLNELFVHTMKNMLRLVYFPVEYVGNSIILFFDPKFFIMQMAESMKANLHHAKAKSLGSTEHRKGLANIVAGPDVYPKYLEYQTRMQILRYSKKTNA